MAFRWSIRTKESECRAGERRCLERGAKRTLVRERRLKVSLAARATRSVRTAQMKKARSSERAYKKKNRHGFPCLQHVTWRRRGDSESRCARFTSSAKASSRFAENSPLGCFPGANRPHRFESPFVVATKQNRHGFRACKQSNWRRRGDSNPRDPGCGPNGFRDRRIQPLCHPSEGATKKVV